MNATLLNFRAVHIFNNFLQCKVYSAAVGLYGRHVNNETLLAVLGGIKESLPWIQSQIAGFGISSISKAAAVQDGYENRKEWGNNAMNDMSALLSQTNKIHVHRCKIWFQFGDNILFDSIYGFDYVCSIRF
jgi:hypothetical protein